MFTDKQKKIIKGIKKGMDEGKTNKTIADDFGISEVYLQKLKQRAGLTQKTSIIKDWIVAHSEIEEWLDEIREGKASESSRMGMAGFLKRYCSWRGQSPRELLEEAEEDLGKRLSDRVVKGHLVKFRRKLREEDKSDSTVRSYMSTINSFFGYHEVLLPKLSHAPIEQANDKIKFTVDMIKELLTVCNIRERAIFLTMFETGLGANEVANLKISDLNEMQDDITILRLRRKKAAVKFVTFMGRDARHAIEAYLKVRNEGNLIPYKPELSKGAKAQSKDDYLFVTFNNHTNEWSAIDPKYIASYMRIACTKLGWETKGQRINKWRPHALRAGFSTILENAGIPKNRVDFMLGHKPSNQDRAYFENKERELFENYKNCEHLLSVSELEKVPDSKYEELMIELHARNGEIAKLSKDLKEMKQIETERTPIDDTMYQLLSDPKVQAALREKMEKIKNH